MILNLPINAAGRDFAVGDLHGCLPALQSLLDHVGFDIGKDRLLAVGDLIDRGHASLQCLELLSQPWFYAVRGNHEARALEWFAQPGSGDLELMWRIDGGAWFFQLDARQRQHCRTLMLAMPWVMQVTAGQRRYAILHAEVPPEIDDLATFLQRLQAGDDAVQQACIWGRERYLSNSAARVRGVDWVIGGHTPGEPKNALHGNCLDIDFCAFAMENGGALGMLELGSDRLYLRDKRRITPLALGSLR
jgi:serine/threonine protein phosphatase 1